MVGIRTGFVVLMACQTGKYTEIRRIGMALRARCPLTTMLAAVNREVLAVVVEGGRCPDSGVVAGFAGRWEFGRGMRRIGRRVVVVQVTRHACGGRTLEAHRMALVASQGSMRTSQCKGCCRIVVERTGLPGCIRMASLAFGA